MMVPDHVVDVTVMDEGRKAVEVAAEASEVVAAFLVEAEVSCLAALAVLVVVLACLGDEVEMLAEAASAALVVLEEAFVACDSVFLP